MAVIEGNQAGTLDSDRIRALGCQVTQIETGVGCHLDAMMIRRVLDSSIIPNGSRVFIDNVGNLVCPALFDLGEEQKVVILSVAEGEESPSSIHISSELATLCSSRNWICWERCRLI
jgi:hydrogenase nickel incorporation protein HypB